MINQTPSPTTMRIRISGLEPNPIDKAAITIAAEAVNSMEPIRSVFIDYSFLFPFRFSAPVPDIGGRAKRRQYGIMHFLSIMRVYTSFVTKIYLGRVNSCDRRPRVGTEDMCSYFTPRFATSGCFAH